MADSLVDLNSGALAPVASELTVDELVVTGEIPPELNGALLRNGPNPLSGTFDGAGMLSWWVAPAMLHSLVLADGRAIRYSNRWARTAAWQRHTSPEADVSPTLEHNPNVNVVQHGGQLLAMGEGSVPFSIDHTFTPDQPFTFDGAVPNGMTAHPNVDPASGELIYFRADWQAPFLSYGVIDPDGKQTVDQIIELDGPAMMHDMAITSTKALVLDLSVAYDFDLLRHGAPIPLRWFDERSSRIGVLDRRGGPAVWVDIDPCFIQHVVNAYDQDDGTIVLDAVRYPDFLRFDHDEGDYHPNPLGVLWRYVIDLDTTRVTETQLDDRNVELPRINEQYTGQSARFAYAVEQPTDQEMSGLIKYDLAALTDVRHRIQPGDQNSEPIFVPRQTGASSVTGRAQDDGWVLACIYRAATHTTDVVILNAQDFGADPVATVHLPVPIPAGFHGAWIPTPVADS